MQRYVKFTQAKYDQLFKPGVAIQPICCFGDVRTATVVTVGVNPSVGEFENGHWPPEEMSHIPLARRCKSYFAADGVAPYHDFFTPWKQALACLGTSYETGAAVHLDLSPRASRYVREFREPFEQELFLEMIQRDLWVFFATLDLCRNAKLLLIAGSVTGRYYINEFLQRFAPDYGYALGGAFDRGQCKGKGKTCWHELSSPSRKLPVFFCSCGPAANDPTVLPSRICHNAEELRLRLKQ